MGTKKKGWFAKKREAMEKRFDEYKEREPERRKRHLEDLDYQIKVERKRKSLAKLRKRTETPRSREMGMGTIFGGSGLFDEYVPDKKGKKRQPILRY